jgi:hypothetical protein
VSYFDRCPDRWEAEREGRDDASREYHGYVRRPDPDHFACDDAQRAYEDSYRSEMHHQDEMREEQEAAERRAYERRAEEAAMEAAAEAAYWREMEAAQYEAPEEAERAEEEDR